jgi:hypothetical protein
MEIKPAGVERDRQIAEIRGDGQPIYRPYSTDITAAMELWEEMVVKGAYYLIKTRKLSRRGNVYRVRIMRENALLFTGADTEGLNKAMAAAISGAWMRWREK